jgi:hypothetical protein
MIPTIVMTVPPTTNLNTSLINKNPFPLNNLTIKNEFGLVDEKMFGPKEKYYLAYNNAGSYRKEL